MKPPGLILLAAGGSTRMKKPKQLLPWGELSLLQLACQTALQTPCRPIVVVLGHEAEACRRQIADLAVTVLIHPEWRNGMGTSIAAGITALELADLNASGALILLVDQPSVKAAFLDSLISKWSPPQRLISATSYDGRGGVPAIFDRTLFPDLKTLDPERGARALIAQETDRTTLTDPGETLIDLDTPEVYKQQKQKGSVRPAPSAGVNSPASPKA